MGCAEWFQGRPSPYDDLMARGMFRDEARAEVRHDIDAVLSRWRQTAGEPPT